MPLFLRREPEGFPEKERKLPCLSFCGFFLREHEGWLLCLTNRAFAAKTEALINQGMHACCWQASEAPILSPATNAAAQKHGCCIPKANLKATQRHMRSIFLLILCKPWGCLWVSLCLHYLFWQHMRKEKRFSKEEKRFGVHHSCLIHPFPPLHHPPVHPLECPIPTPSYPQSATSVPVYLFQSMLLEGTPSFGQCMAY